MKTYTRKEQLQGKYLVTWHCSKRGRNYTINKRGDSNQEAFDKLNRYQRSQITYDCDYTTNKALF